MIELKQRMLEVAFRTQAGHLGSSLSVLNIIWVLHDRVMAPDDRFVLSKCHGVLALHVVQEAKGLISAEQIMKFGTPDLPALPLHNTPHQLFSTGSLGHGAAVSVGLARGMRMRGTPGRVFCLLGDQELNEGSCWEAAMLAARFDLSNLIWIIDDNGSADASLPMRPIGDKFVAFGWTFYAVDGHNNWQIEDTLAVPAIRMPRCIVANTKKGNGIPMIEKNPGMWHYRQPSSEQELSELKAGIVR
jgi:transketolase